MGKTSEFLSVEGQLETQKGLLEIAERAQEYVDEAALAVAELVIETARPNVPVQTGAASDSLQAYMAGDQAVAEGGADVDYYAWLEYGGASGRDGSNVRETEANGRYIQPAYEEVEGDVTELLLTGLTSLVEDAGLDPH